MSRSIGDCSLNISRSADYYKYKKNHFYLLHVGTDGIYDVCDNQELVERILKFIENEKTHKDNPLVHLYGNKKQ